MALVVGLVYLALSQYVIWLNDPVNAGAGFWPGAGATLAALVLLPRRQWGWVLGAVVVAEIAGGIPHGYPVAASGVWAVANAVEPTVAALLLARIGWSGRLVPVRELARFLLVGVLIGPLLGAVIGSVGTWAEYGGTWHDILLKWWAGDGLGVLVVAPVFLCFRERTIDRNSRSEAVVLALLVVTVPLLAFRNWHPEWDVVLPYVVLPLIIWASLRFGLRGAAFAGFIVAQLANLTTALGYGPFHLGADSSGHAVTVLQVFLAVALTVGFVTAALVHDARVRTSLYERQRSVAEVLQLAARPERLPEVAGIELAARYEPAASDAVLHIGGDWFDAFELPSGALAFVVGDVAGHDLPAAAAMGQLRSGLRTLFTATERPDVVLAALDQQLASWAEPTVATVLCGRYEAGVLNWASAGHPPPLLVEADGTARFLEGEPSPLLGMGTSDYECHRTSLEPGDLVVGYTDGLVEHRTWSLSDGFEHLRRLAVATGTGDLEALCDRLLVEGLDGRHRSDDACLLALRRTDPAVRSDSDAGVVAHQGAVEIRVQPTGGEQ